MHVYRFSVCNQEKGATDHMDGDPYSNNLKQAAVRSNLTHG